MDYRHMIAPDRDPCPDCDGRFCTMNCSDMTLATDAERKAYASRCNMYRMADYLDDCANKYLNEAPQGPTDSFMAQRCMMGSAYRMVAANLRVCADNPDG